MAEKPKLRAGRRVPIHLYEQYGSEPSDHDEPVGTVWVDWWAQRIVDAMNADPGELVHLRELVEHYRHRHEMTPSERESYFDEDASLSCEPERSAYANAARHVADNLTDPAAMSWTVETAQRLGLDVKKTSALMFELAAQIREYGRPLGEQALRLVSGEEQR